MRVKISAYPHLSFTKGDAVVCREIFQHSHVVQAHTLLVLGDLNVAARVHYPSNVEMLKNLP